MPTITTKTDTGENDRNGNDIFAFGKIVVAFESTVPALTAKRLRLLDRQVALTRLKALVDAGDDISDVARDATPDSLQRLLTAVTTQLAEVDEALAL